MDVETVSAQWRAVQRNTEPADRATAEHGLELLYRASGWRPPRRVRWCDSPAAAGPLVAATREPALFAAGVDHFDAPAIRTAFAPTAWEALQRAFSRRIRDRVKRLVEDAVRERGVAQTPALQRPGCGQHDAMWVGVFDAGQRVFGVEQPSALDGWMTLTRSAGWWWAFRETAFACERQAEVHLDDRDRLHALDGPALRFADGFELFAIHGVRVESWIVDEPARITVANISAQQNSEVRRVLMERYGTARYLSETAAEKIARDDFGTLYLVPSPNGVEPLMLVEVRNATPEPDGTTKDYFLRVPPTMRTPREAVAWTFGLDAGQYAPKIQT